MRRSSYVIWVRRHPLIVLLVALVAGPGPAGRAGVLERIGHTTLTPRHTAPDDKGMYSAVIDPTNGYAYFFGNYLFKLDVTGALPAQVGASIQTGQSSEAAIDPAAGYAYLPKGSGTIFRYALGAGTNSPSSAGSLSLAGTWATSIVIDDSDPNPANHYGYVLCSGTPATVFKVALGTFAAVSSVILNAGENNFAWGQIDTKNGYAYFASYIIYTAPAIPQVLKIKLTPGASAPVRVGIASLGATPVPLWTSSIDTLHGYLYYGTDNGTTNVPETVFKVKVGDGDALPSPVPFGGVSLHTNEVQLISQVVDPVHGYLYFGDDNTYPGRIYQFSLNGTNPPVEIGYLSLQGGTSLTNPPNGITANNTTNSGADLPFGEVFLRSAVFDPVRGCAYFGQDSRPNQVVKVQLARDVPFITSAAWLPGAGFELSFTNTPGVSNTVLSAPSLAFPATDWVVLGAATEMSSGKFQFTDPTAGSSGQRYYRIQVP